MGQGSKRNPEKWKEELGFQVWGGPRGLSRKKILLETGGTERYGKREAEGWTLSRREAIL